VPKSTKITIQPGKEVTPEVAPASSASPSASP
jgi:hypothetical protein